MESQTRIAHTQFSRNVFFGETVVWEGVKMPQRMVRGRFFDRTCVRGCAFEV